MIVLAEDDSDQRLALKLALQTGGYSVREAGTGAGALALMRQKAPRFLITDIFMPDMDGLELVQKAREEFPDTRVIVVSGGGQRTKGDYFTSAELLGAHATLQKPFDVRQLMDLLALLAKP